MKNKLDFGKMKEMMALEVNSKSLKDNREDIINTMVNLSTRGLKLVLGFKRLTSEEFDEVIRCIIEHGDESEYNIVAVTKTDYIGTDSEKSGETKVLFIYTTDFDIPVVVIDSLNKRMLINVDNLYMGNLEEMKNNISKSEFIKDIMVSVIREPLSDVLGEDNPILEKVNTFGDIDITGRFNDTWNPLSATTTPCGELDEYYELDKYKKYEIDDFSIIMSLLSSMDLMSVYQAEKGVRQVSDGIRYNLMKLSMEESLPIDAILRDHKLLKELKRRTLNGLISETIAKSQLVEREGLDAIDQSYKISDFVNENNRNFTLCLTALMIEFDVEPNVNGFSQQDRVLELFNSTKRMYLDFIDKLLDIDLNDLLKDGFNTIYHYTRHKVAISKYQAAKEVRSELMDMLDRLKSSDEVEDIENGKIKLS